MQINPCAPLRGEITVPGDKSISHRAVMLGALASGTTHITGFLMGEDCLSTIDCFRKMGVSIDVSDKEVVVEGVGLHGLTAPKSELYTGNSGTTTRLLSGILAGQSFTSTMNGDASIQKRPMGRVMKPLREMGASIEGRDDNFCPMTMHPSELHGIEYRLPVASAQLKSAILLAGLYAEGQTTVIEPAPSRDHTERMFRALGVEIETNGNVITLEPPEDLHAVDIAVPADISSAAFFLVAGAIVPGSELTIRNVGVNPTRTGILDVLRSMGADITESNFRDDAEPVCDLTVRHSRLHGTEIGGGSIRIHDSKLQAKMFEVLGFTAEEAQVRFGFLMDAFKFGAPPHGGLAFGFDRLCSLFGGSDSIRDYIAFPKNNNGRDMMLDAPGCIDQAQLYELCLSLVKPAEK